MLKYLFFAVILLPIIEITLLVKLGSAIGIAETIILVLGTGVLGAYLAKQQGIKSLKLFYRNMQTGQMTEDQLWDGVLLLLAALFLIIPGALTDIIGLTFFVPYIKNIYRTQLKAINWVSILRGAGKTYSYSKPKTETKTQIKGRVIDI